MMIVIAQQQQQEEKYQRILERGLPYRKLYIPGLTSSSCASAGPLGNALYSSPEPSAIQEFSTILS